MKIIVCGDRGWTDKEKIRQRLALLPKDCIIIEGEQRGADLLAREVAEELGMKVDPHPADWKKYGNKAGPLRNLEMLHQEPDLVIGFHSNIFASKGTRHMLGIAEDQGIPTELIC